MPPVNPPISTWADENTSEATYGWSNLKCWNAIMLYLIQKLYWSRVSNSVWLLGLYWHNLVVLFFVFININELFIVSTCMLATSLGPRLIPNGKESGDTHYKSLCKTLHIAQPNQITPFTWAPTHFIKWSHVLNSNKESRTIRTIATFEGCRVMYRGKWVRLDLSVIGQKLLPSLSNTQYLMVQYSIFENNTVPSNIKYWTKTAAVFGQ